MIVPQDSVRAKASGDEAGFLAEARLKMNAAADNLAYAENGQAEYRDVVAGSIQLIDAALKLAEQA